MVAKDQQTLALKINTTLESYRQMRARFEAHEVEIEKHREKGNHIPEALTDRLAKAKELLDELRRQLIRMQNDYLRRHLAGGRLLVTSGVQARGSTFVEQAIAAVHSFDSFSEDNDPYGEHDFGAVGLEGERLFFKIDAYDQKMEYGSDDPALPEKTTRVMTVMLAEEY